MLVPDLEASIFVIPRAFVKNGLERYVVLNAIARSVIDSCRGEHPEFVFTGDGDPVTKLYNSAWKAARRRASERYGAELGKPCPTGFRNIRVHDLKHTFGFRLRSTGVGFEDRQMLLGHKSSYVTTHYSAPEIGLLIEACEKVCALGSCKSPALAIVRSEVGSQVTDRIGGKGGTRTLDPGIMSAPQLGPENHWESLKGPRIIGLPTNDGAVRAARVIAEFPRVVTGLLRPPYGS